MAALLTQHFDLGDVARAFEMAINRSEDMVRIVIHS